MICFDWGKKPIFIHISDIHKFIHILILLFDAADMPAVWAAFSSGLPHQIMQCTEQECIMSVTPLSKIHHEGGGYPYKLLRSLVRENSFSDSLLQWLPSSPCVAGGVRTPAPDKSLWWTAWTGYFCPHIYVYTYISTCINICTYICTYLFFKHSHACIYLCM